MVFTLPLSFKGEGDIRGEVDKQPEVFYNGLVTESDTDITLLGGGYQLAGVAEQDAKRECPNLCPAERCSRECPYFEGAGW